MSNPASFTASTPRFELPNLIAGQAQKEFYVNEAFSRIDSLLHPSVEGETATPPNSPVEGQCWLVGNAATGDWADEDGNLAAWQAGAWTFIAPQSGTRIIDSSTGGSLYFDGTWTRLSAPTEPSGGAQIDEEARDAIVNVIATLRSAGILPTN